MPKPERSHRFPSNRRATASSARSLPSPAKSCRPVHRLFEVMNPDPVWIKVPVYVGELSDVSAEAPARIKSLADPADAPGVVAQPVSAPPTAVPQAAAVDLYYALPNPELKFRPGQRVSATLTLGEARESLVVPWSAVVHDINGGAWVYEMTARILMSADASRFPLSPMTGRCWNRGPRRLAGRHGGGGRIVWQRIHLQPLTRKSVAGRASPGWRWFSWLKSHGCDFSILKPRKTVMAQRLLRNQSSILSACISPAQS